MIEPEIGGWGGSHARDGAEGQFSLTHGETYNCPAEVAEARYGVTVDYLSFHDEDGGKGVRIDYRIRSDNSVADRRLHPLRRAAVAAGRGAAWLTQPLYYIRRANGASERYAV